MVNYVNPVSAETAGIGSVAAQHPENLVAVISITLHHLSAAALFHPALESGSKAI